MRNVFRFGVALFLAGPTFTQESRLVGVERVPEMAEVCLYQHASTASAGAARSDGDQLRPPVRMIRDTYPAFSSVAVDAKRDVVVFTDENLFQILSYDRRANTPPHAAITEPLRAIRGRNTHIEFQCGLYIDPETGEIWAINNDTVNAAVIFDKDADGNVAPVRMLETPHGTFGIAADEKTREVFLTIQHDSAVVVYDKKARDQEPPIRLLQGDRTRLADPHGVAVDSARGLMFVTNFGSTHVKRPRETMKVAVPNWPLERRAAIPGTGRFGPPSITIYSSKASGNTAPLRAITGPKTQLNWPTGIAFHPTRNELFVVNDTDHSVLVFDADADGDVAPRRMIQGAKTELRNPTGVHVDLAHQELWIANFGNHTATVYSIDAHGDTPPIRRIRSAPIGQDSLMIGNPGALGFDTKRGEILVPN